MVDRYASVAKPKRSRQERIEAMGSEVLDVDGAATLLGVSSKTIYALARKGDIPAMRVGREWRFARKNLIAWITNGSQADHLTNALRNGRIVRRRA